RVKIAQPPLAILDIRLDDIAALAAFRMPLVALGKLGGDELLSFARRRLAEARDEIVVKSPVAADIAGFQNRGQYGAVGLCEPDRILDAARGMAHLEPAVPERIEQEIDDALAPSCLSAGKQKQQIDVGSGREGAAPIAADGDYRHALRLFR